MAPAKAPARIIPSVEMLSVPARSAMVSPSAQNASTAAKRAADEYVASLLITSKIASKKPFMSGSRPCADRRERSASVADLQDGGRHEERQDQQGLDDVGDLSWHAGGRQEAGA